MFDQAFKLGLWRQGFAAAIGMMEAVEFPSASHCLAPGDTLMVMSDGVCEARDGLGTDFDLACIATLAREAAGAGVAALADVVIGEVQRHRVVEARS